MSFDLLDTPAIQAELASTAPDTASAAQVASLLFDASLTHAHGPLLDAYIHLISTFLSTGQAASRADRLHLITLRHILLLRREAEELAADSSLRHDRALAAKHFARKAQSGFSPYELPE